MHVILAASVQITASCVSLHPHPHCCSCSFLRYCNRGHSLSAQYKPEGAEISQFRGLAWETVGLKRTTPLPAPSCIQSILGVSPQRVSIQTLPLSLHGFSLKGSLPLFLSVACFEITSHVDQASMEPAVKLRTALNSGLPTSTSQVLRLLACVTMPCMKSAFLRTLVVTVRAWVTWQTPPRGPQFLCLF